MELPGDGKGILMLTSDYIHVDEVRQDRVYIECNYQKHDVTSIFGLSEFRKLCIGFKCLADHPNIIGTSIQSDWCLGWLEPFNQDKVLIELGKKDVFVRFNLTLEELKKIGCELLSQFYHYQLNPSPQGLIR